MSDQLPFDENGCQYIEFDGHRRLLGKLLPDPGVMGAFPALEGSKIVMGPKADNIQILLKGKPGTAMQSFAAQLNDVEIAAVITYSRASWANAGKGQDPVVAPADIKAAR